MASHRAYMMYGCGRESGTKTEKKVIICNVWSSTRFVSSTKLVRESWVSNDTDKRSQGSYSDHNVCDTITMMKNENE